MCLAIPGIIQRIKGEEGLARVGEVLFGGVLREINLSCLPEAKDGDYVIAHAGVALQILDQQEAQKIIDEFARLQKDV